MSTVIIEWPGYPSGHSCERGILEFHPIANLFPLLEGEEFRELCGDIRRNGQQQPILTYEGKILDGRNRYRACTEVGEEPWTERWVGEDPVEAALSLNLHRRHLSSGQKAMIGLEAEKVMAKEARKRQAHGATAPGRTLPQKIAERSDADKILNKSTDSSGESREQAAKLVGTNRQYISDAKKLTQVDPEAAEKVRRGEVSLGKAMKPYRKPAEAASGSGTPGAIPELDLPPFDLPEERRVYKKIIVNLKEIAKLDADEIVAHCKGLDEADREVEHLSDLIGRLGTLRSKFQEKRREYSNLRAVK